MTKEETAAWRKEQRRKRNRESAAASRQKQRDRIDELEVEVGQWRSKYEEAMRKLVVLEQKQQSSPAVLSSNDVQSFMTDLDGATSAMISPCASPQVSSMPAPSVDMTVLSSLHIADAIPSETKSYGFHAGRNIVQGSPVKALSDREDQEEEVNTHLTESISRPA